MSEEHGRAMQETGAAAAQWERTLWVMVGIQFIMTGALPRPSFENGIT
jgi:hypothetical protein